VTLSSRSDHYRTMTSDTTTVLLLVVAVAGLTVAGAAPAAAADDTATATLTVTVTDGLGNTIGDAEVTATWDGGSTTRTTAGNGKAFVDVPDGERVELNVSHPSYVRNSPVVLEEASERDVEIQVFREATASARVVDDDGSPVANAQVTLLKRGNVAAQGQTDSNGRFTTGTIEQGDYRVVVRKSGFYVNDTTAAVRGDTEFSVDVRRGSVPVTFRVTDDHFDPARPVESAQVAVGDIGTLNTGSQGEQTVSVPVNSQVQVDVTKDGYSSASRTVQIGESARELSFSISREDGLSVSVGNTQILVDQRVRVVVTDEDGETVEGARVTVDGEAVGETGADGVYEAQLSQPGDHDIAATADGVSSEPVVVEAVQADDDDEADTATATARPDDDTETPTIGDPVSQLPVPGFGPVAAVLALVAAALVAARRR